MGKIRTDRLIEKVNVSFVRVFLEKKAVKS